MNKKYLASVLMLLILFSNLFAEPGSSNFPRIGLTASLTNSHLDIMLPIFLLETISIAPAFSYASVEDVGTDISIGALLRIYRPKDKYAPFIGLGLASLSYKPEENNDFPTNSEQVNDFILSPHLGIERYIDDRFCIGISAQYNMTTTDNSSFRFGYPGKKVTNTATSLYVTLFF